MRDRILVERLIRSRRALVEGAVPPRRKADAEGGCGVIGIACSVPVAGRHLLQALVQMRNRGNGKGGGIAAVGLDPGFFGVPPAMLRDDYLVAVGYLDPAARPRVEAEAIAPTFLVDHQVDLPHLPDYRALAGLEVPPPEVVCYFVRVRPEVRRAWAEEHDLTRGDLAAIDDEIVYQNTYRLNRTFYASTGEKQAFVLSHGKNLLVLKMVGYGDDVVRYYRLEGLRAQVWIGHHRYPTKGKVWHPGGAHPFIGMHEALVHNGDFANYASISAYLAQRRIYPLFLTDTEVAVLMFDLLYRVFGYPLEYVIEALAPTTERDFALLPAERRRIYRMLQACHIHGSPDGPWFFLIAQSDPVRRAARLIGITDTSMLRPQVFALQVGEAAIGFAASEKQAIDAALESLASEDGRFWPRADLYWNARGGSHTDGGAFLFTVTLPGEGAPAGADGLVCTDKFGRRIAPRPDKRPPRPAAAWGREAPHANPHPPAVEAPASRETGALARVVALVDGMDPDAFWQGLVAALPGWHYDELEAVLARVVRVATSATDTDRCRQWAIEMLTRLLDARLPTGTLKRSVVAAMTEAALGRVFDAVRRAPSPGFLWTGVDGPPLPSLAPDTTLIVEARGFPPEGPVSLARRLVDLYRHGARRILVAHSRGHRFIGCGFGPGSTGLRLDIYGASGDYLGSGIDGAEIVVHGSAQDQLGQIMKAGRLVVHGDVGQTFLYGAKGGDVFVLGHAAGRPLINAVGRPRVVINGTCLDYLAESFMAGDPLEGGGFVIVNGVVFDEDGALVDLETPYPGGNLFSLASGGALYMRDPYGRLGDDQLNGGAFAALTPADWDLIRPYLEENERLFGIPLARLLTVDGAVRSPAAVYRKIVPAGHRALAPEEAWVRKEA